MIIIHHSYENEFYRCNEIKEEGDYLILKKGDKELKIHKSNVGQFEFPRDAND